MADIYHGSGRPEVKPEHINITKLPLRRYEILLAFDDREYVVRKSSGQSIEMPTTTMRFVVPMCREYEALNKALCDHPESVRLIFRAWYDQDFLAGVSVKFTALHDAWQKVLERVAGPKGRGAQELLVERVNLVELQGLIASHLKIEIDSFGGLSAAERATLRKELLATAMMQMEKLPSVSPLSLHDFEKNALVWTEGKVEAAPVLINDAITTSSTSSKKLDAVDAFAESLSDLARNTNLGDEQFHSEARKRKAEHDGKVGLDLAVIPMQIAGRWTFDEDWSKLDTGKRNEVHAARQVMSNKEHYKRTVLQETATKLVGMMKHDAAIAKCLNLVRVNEEVLAGLTRLEVIDQQVVRRGVEAFDIDVPLKVVDLQEPEDPGEGNIVKRLRELEKRLEESAKVRTKNLSANICIKKVDEARVAKVDGGHQYVYPFVPNPPAFSKEGQEALKKFWLTLEDENGRKLEFGEEVLSVEVRPIARWEEVPAIWAIQARPSEMDKKQVQIVGHAFEKDVDILGKKMGEMKGLANPGEVNIAVELCIKYREK